MEQSPPSSNGDNKVTQVDQEGDRIWRGDLGPQA